MRDGLEVPVFDDVEQAARRLDGWAVRTPLLNNPALDAALGGRVLIKPEILQRTGSFKFRGAFNALSRLSDAQKTRGVVAFSSGNHAQGVAEAAKLLGIRARIVMPHDAPAVKAEGVRTRGAEVIGYDRETEDREQICTRLAQETGAAIIPSFDHPDIIAGQGTCGLEIFQDLAARGERADQLICCVGGGGLIAGINLAAEALSPDTRIYGAEPEGFDDHARSLASGERQSNIRKGGSVQDALLSEAPGRLTFAINRPRLAGIGVVGDAEAMGAVRYAFSVLKLVAEPGGATALAAALSGKIDCKGRTTVIVITGGNVDPALFAKAIG
ncbi:threonine/serine dehydratase [Marinicauda algicola]|uniref:Threonine/serine dehydratase n=1 Tax=Marinicauda algicola TaxID=2029849 RepID=A0A4S2GWG1_9PROT|nr:threonine/serine dehydratase [Marinicauda algicola]TGY87450.1 threonine/serine dehydratase [Marinicauda algicola]